MNKTNKPKALAQPAHTSTIPVWPHWHPSQTPSFIIPNVEIPDAEAELYDPQRDKGYIKDVWPKPDSLGYSCGVVPKKNYAWLEKGLEGFNDADDDEYDSDPNYNLFSAKKPSPKPPGAQIPTNGLEMPSYYPLKCCVLLPEALTSWPESVRRPLLNVATGVTSRGVKKHPSITERFWHAFVANGKDDDNDKHHTLQEEVVLRYALFKVLLPSFLKTYDCDIDYLITIAFDSGDSFYDSESGLSLLKKYLDQKVALPLTYMGVRVKFLLVTVKNDEEMDKDGVYTFKGKPGPVFNAMLRESYNNDNFYISDADSTDDLVPPSLLRREAEYGGGGGADFFYRVNDDTELLAARDDAKFGKPDNKHGDQWGKAFIKALIELPGPVYGVVGPSHDIGNMNILTHDFVHRKHLDIFAGTYYNVEFKDWWMDDYISHLYGGERSRMLKDYPVGHRSTMHGQRYTVGESKSHLLGKKIFKDREKIAEFMGAGERASFIKGKGFGGKVSLEKLK